MKKIYSLILFFIGFIGYLNSQVTYTGKPTYKIDIKRAGTYIGSINIELFPSLAYHHVRNFDSLVAAHFYDSTAFHRVIPGFMIQGGDPNSRSGPTSTWGYGQPGQPTVNAEFSTVKHLRGILSAARSSNINSATSQFFICVAAAASLNGNYSVYGRVTSGLNIVDTIVLAPRNANDLPNLKHEMFITATGSNDSLPTIPVLTAPVYGAINTSTNLPVSLIWGTVAGAIEYEVEVSDDPFYLNIYKSAKTNAPIYSLNTGLIPDTKYYWHVRANNGGHISDWSTDMMFSTELDAVGIIDLNSNPTHVNIFPNPSKGKFTFRNLNIGDRLRVSDIDGKVIFDQIIKDSVLNLNLEGREKGVYVYSLQKAGLETSNGRLILE